MVPAPGSACLATPARDPASHLTSYPCQAPSWGDPTLQPYSPVPGISSSVFGLTASLP